MPFTNKHKVILPESGQCYEHRHCGKYGVKHTESLRLGLDFGL